MANIYVAISIDSIQFNYVQEASHHDGYREGEHVFNVSCEKIAN